MITWVKTVLVIGVGFLSFRNLSMLEDPEFTIKEAVVVTPHPGASAAEVKEEVTNVLEKAIQQLGQLEWLESGSSRNMSQIKVRIKDKYDKQSLLGATFIAIAAVAAIGTSPDDTGEYCRTLFSVILISLTLSWVTAVTTTPLLCKNFLKTGSKEGKGDKMKDPYGSAFYRFYRKFLSTSIRFRWITVGVVVGLFGMALVGFGHVKNLFFPNSTTPMYYVDFWFPEGTHIDETSRLMKEPAVKFSFGSTARIRPFCGSSPKRRRIFLWTILPARRCETNGEAGSRWSGASHGRSPCPKGRH